MEAIVGSQTSSWWLMRYPKDHKAETHAKIVENASVQLRERGARGIGVADLMRDVGLTHGGFYAHFASRDDLLNEAIVRAFDGNADSWSKVVNEVPVGGQLPALVERYLSVGHRDHPGHGCTFAALAADVARESAKTRRVFVDKFDEMVRLIAGADDRRLGAKARKKAIATIATLMGTLVLARVAGNGALSQEILEAGKVAAYDGLEIKAPRKPASRQRAMKFPKRSPRTRL